MADKIVNIAKDPVKARLKELRGKVRDKVKLTPKEMEEAIERILEHLEIN